MKKTQVHVAVIVIDVAQNLHVQYAQCKAKNGESKPVCDVNEQDTSIGPLCNDNRCCEPPAYIECFYKCPYWDHRQSCSVRCTGSQVRFLESEDDCECVFQDAPSYRDYNYVGVPEIYVSVVSLITLMIWLIMLGCKVKARLCAKKTRPIGVVNDRRTTVRPETLRMNFKLKTEGKKHFSKTLQTRE
ncbi:WISP1 [Mytilus edulis]|uniref:WISP1 n=1 Tax=Mytilus edulis TaxID=6550 RepID=A0A8S3TPY8_MYTED|nr:WISP1 [Mytilus edulis]